ncbi:MAG: beta-lactamase family protein [Verrucomicrobiae bacterium]|nr:beta-lactamase family protein [Verrucomicrobiae bacterium]
MSMARGRLRVALALAATVSTGGWAAPPVIPAAVRSSARQRVDYGYAPGIVIAMVNAEGRTYFTHGRRDWSPESPLADETTLYEIGSVTKTFTTALLAEMVSRGEVSLETRVQTLLPPGVGMPANGGADITLLQLATHRSGLPANPPDLLETGAPLDNVFENYSVAHLHAWLSGATLGRSPGAAFEYSNLGMGLLGHALALRGGVEFEALLVERILEPLGLADTRVNLSPGQMSRLAPGHSGVVRRPPFRMNALGAAGALRSTVSDLATYLEHQMGLRSGPLSAALASTQTFRAMSDMPSVGLGLAWWRWNFSDTIVQHGGDTLGSTAFIAWRPATGVGVAILCNARANADVALLQIGFNCLTSEVSVNTPAAPATVAEATLRKYVGHYGPADAGFTATLALGRLVLAYADQPAFTLYPQSHVFFRAPDVASSAIFVLNPNGGGETLRWTQGGTTTVYSRMRRPPALTFTADGSPPALTLAGEGDATYTLERSVDLANWEFVRDWTVWEGPVRPDIRGEMDFFRLRTP